MVSLSRKNQGFTIVELLIVIVVIGILVGLVYVTFTGVTQKRRNSERQTDIGALNAHIEAFYAQTDNYPTFAQLNDASWRGTNMKGLNPDALVDPKGGTITSTPPGANTFHYSYTPTQSSGGSATACSSADVDTNDTACDTYTLQANLEGSTQPNAYTKQSN